MALSPLTTLSEFIAELRARYEPGSRVASLEFGNLSDRETSIILEPWGDFLTVSPGASYTIVAYCPINSPFKSDITVGWSGADISVWNNGVAEEFRIFDNAGNLVWVNGLPVAAPDQPDREGKHE